MSTYFGDFSRKWEKLINNTLITGDTMIITRVEVHFTKETGKDKFIRDNKDIEILDAGKEEGCFYIKCEDGEHYFSCKNVARFSIFNEIAQENAILREHS